MTLNRRQLLAATATSLAFLGLRRSGLAHAVPIDDALDDPRPLRPDPEGLFELPPDYSYTVLARRGQRMDDGLLLPGDPDGMAAFPGPDGRVILICNHELDQSEVDAGAFGSELEYLTRLDREHLFDAGHGTPSLGGTTTHRYNPATRRLEHSFLSLAGTERNCAGGPTPWGSWLSCEESVLRAGSAHRVDHGWVFEVPSTATEIVAPAPLRAMGRFNHEACAIDPATGIVYMTEDRGDGLLYRFVPDRPGRLAAGGRLQALALADQPAADTRNWPDSGAATVPRETRIAVRWIDLDGVDAPDDDLRVRGRQRGAAIFARGEGMWFGRGEIYFAATSGGPRQLGQIFRLAPGEAWLELFVESGDPADMKNCDNLTVAPWGDLVVCEDRPDGARLIGVRPDGTLYRLGRNVRSGRELCGICLSPDGGTLFVNLQDDGFTIAIHGPLPKPA